MFSQYIQSQVRGTARHNPRRYSAWPEFFFIGKAFLSSVQYQISLGQRYHRHPIVITKNDITADTTTSPQLTVLSIDPPQPLCGPAGDKALR